MAWAPLPPDPPPVAWWTELAAAQEQADLDRFVEGVANEVRAEKIERLQALVHETDMAAAGALARDRWNRIQDRAWDIGWRERERLNRGP